MKKLSTLSIILAAIYPLAAYIGLWLEQPLIVISYLAFLLLLISITKLSQRQWLTSLIILSCITLIFIGVQKSFSEYLLYLPPVLILLSLFGLFSQTLAANQTPLISQYAIKFGNKTDAKHMRYYRTLTILWAGLFLLMASISILLAVFSSIETWSLYTHIISYLVVGIFFIAEFFYRKKLFTEDDHGSFIYFMRKIIKTRPHSLTNK